MISSDQNGATRKAVARLVVLTIAGFALVYGVVSAEHEYKTHPHIRALFLRDDAQ